MISLSAHTTQVQGLKIFLKIVSSFNLHFLTNTDVRFTVVSQINPKTVVISTNFPLGMEKVIRDQDDATGYEVLLKPSQSFSKFKAIAKIESILKKSPNVFYPTYEQRIAMSRINLRQNDAFSEIDLNPYFGSLFENGNDIGVSQNVESMI
jgi:hypothetical protein